MASFVVAAAVALLVVSALTTLGVGLFHWRQTWGKLLALAALLTLLATGFVILAVLITVWRGSMG